MTNDSLSEAESLNAGARARGNGEPGTPDLASVISNPRWRDRITATKTDDELASTAWSIFRAALNQSTRGPAIRNHARRRAAALLIELTEDLSR